VTAATVTGQPQDVNEQEENEKANEEKKGLEKKQEEQQVVDNADVSHVCIPRRIDKILLGKCLRCYVELMEPQRFSSLSLNATINYHELWRVWGRFIMVSLSFTTKLLHTFAHTLLIKSSSLEQPNTTDELRVSHRATY
jgi:hypothetical protein